VPLPSAPREEFLLDLPGYEQWSLLGQGGFSRVYAARRSTDGLEVAVKIALRSNDPRFAREAAVMRRLVAPIAPVLFEAGHTIARQPYLVMERVRGTALDTWLSRPAERVRSLEAKVALGGALSRAIDRVHQAAVVHRDLKPAHILLRGEDRDGATEWSSPEDAGPITLLDFGLARVLDATAPGELEVEEITKEGARLGTVLYMSPEQCEGTQADARADIYTLGVILFEILTGRTPFVGDPSSVTVAHASRRPPRPSQLADVPRALDAIVLRCLAKRPEDRFVRAREVADALAEAHGRFACGAPSDVSAAAAPAPAPSASAEEPTPRMVPSSEVRAVQVSSRRPVALLGLRTSAAPGRVAEVIGLDQGVIARVIDGGYVVAFPEHLSLDAGIRAALRVAERALPLASNPVVHLAELLVRHGPRGALVMGSALGQADIWAPHDGSPRVSLTPQASAALEPISTQTVDESTTPSSADRAPPRLRGRDELVAAVRAEAERCVAERVPTLGAVLGEVGHGKTRLIEAIGAAVAPLFSRVVTLGAVPPERHDSEALLRALLRLALDIEENPTIVAIQGACAARLGADAPILWAPVAYALGALSERRPELAEVLGAPGGLRRALARAIGFGLRRRAAEAPLALLIDDSQWAEAAALDAFEIATLAGAEVALWIQVTARPSLLGQRPLWGERAGGYVAHELSPLAPGPAQELLRELFLPVEFVPEQVLADLHRVTGGVPLYLVEVVHALRLGGRVRQRPGTNDWYLAADDPLGISATPLAEQLGERALAILPPKLRDVLRLGAVLGAELTAVDFAAVQGLLEADGTASSDDSAMDAGVGLSRLVGHGVLQHAGRGHYRFRHPFLRDAIEALTPDVERRRYHDAARRHLAAVAAENKEVLPRLARHAAACGEGAQAAQAYLELAEAAMRRHRHVEAEQLYTSALQALSLESSAHREIALTGRGQARTCLERLHDARDDLKAAQSLAESRGDAATVASLLLDQATLLDFSSDYASSAATVDRAAPLVEQCGDPRLLARLVSAEGRSHFRAVRAREAIERFYRAIELATRVHDTQTQCESLLLLAPALIADGQLDEAAARYDEVIALCERIGDRFHLGVAYLNRMVLWIKRQDHERAAADQRLAVTIARELGRATLEAFATANLAELLYYQGALVEALALARRSDDLLIRCLGRRFLEVTVIRARIEAAAGREDEASKTLAALREQCAGEAYVTAMIRAVELMLRDPRLDEPAAWDALIEDLRACSLNDERIDAMYHAAARAILAGRWREARGFIARGRAEAMTGPMWQRRFAELAARLPET
jgi:tetratricopeptide (TPR) repeat protein